MVKNLSGGASVAQANSSLAFGSKRNNSRTLHRQASNSSNTSEKNYQTEKNSGHNSEGRNSNQNSSVANTMHSNSRLENSNSASVSNSTSEKNLSPANKPEDNKQNHSGKTIKSVAYPFMQVSESIKYISVHSRVFHFPKKVLQISGFQLHTTQTTHITQMIMVNLLNHMVNWLNYMVNLINTMVT